jgi:hypothetical protein
MIEVIIVSNGKPLRRVAIYNRGPVGGPDGDSFDKGDHEGGPGLRRYEYHVLSTRPPAKVVSTGTVLHARRDGAERLCATVLDDLIDKNPSATEGKL